MDVPCRGGASSSCFIANFYIRLRRGCGVDAGDLRKKKVVRCWSGLTVQSFAEIIPTQDPIMGNLSGVVCR